MDHRHLHELNVLGLNVSDRDPPHVLPLKDPEAAHPVPHSWRPTLSAIVNCIVRGDAEMVGRVPGVEPLETSVASWIRDSIADYGASLIDLPEDTWQSSQSQWMETHWELLVDLWTAEAGRSDLVLSCKVFDSSDGPRFVMYGVYVP